jgi:hypothetical protein
VESAEVLVGRNYVGFRNLLERNRDALVVRRHPHVELMETGAARYDRGDTGGIKPDVQADGTFLAFDHVPHKIIAAAVRKQST